MADLWGDLPNANDIRTPHSILLEQANHLKVKTQGLLVGNVLRSTEIEHFYNTLQIIAPSLSNYTYNVLRVTHTITLYPCNVHSFAQSKSWAPGDERQLEEVLAEILRSAQVHRVINGLQAQIRADAPPRNQA